MKISYDYYNFSSDSAQLYDLVTKGNIIVALIRIDAHAKTLARVRMVDGGIAVIGENYCHKFFSKNAPTMADDVYEFCNEVNLEWIVNGQIVKA